MPVVRNAKSHVFTLHYDVTNFIRSMPENQSIFAETEHLLETLRHRLPYIETGYFEAQESFANTLCDKIRDTRPIYKAMNFLKLDDTTLRLGRPIRTRIAFEIVLDEKHTKLTFSGDETHSFDILANDFSLVSKDYSRGIKGEIFSRIQSDWFRKQFQEDVLKVAENITFEMQQEPGNKLKLICFRKHDTGICAVMEYKTEGILIDLIPVVSLEKLNNETKNICDKFDPNHHEKRFMEVNGCESSKTDLFLLCESEKVAGTWSLSTFYRDHKVLKCLAEGDRNAFKITEYILQMYLLENKPELDQNDTLGLLTVNIII